MSVTQITDGTNTAGVTAGNAIKVDGSAVTQPVNIAQVNGSTVVTAATGIQKVGISDSAGTSITLGQKVMASSVPVVIASDQSNIQVVGAASSGAAKAGNPVQVGSVFNTTQPTVTTGQVVENQATARGALIVATGVDAFTVVGSKTTNNAAPGATNVGVLPALANAAAPSLTEGNQVALSTDLSGNLRITGSVSATSTAAGLVSTNNSSTANLGANAVFTGTGDDTTNFASIEVTLFTNQASATNGLQLQFSEDNTNWDIANKFTITASTVFSMELVPQSRFFRIVYTNGTVATTTFRLQTVYRVDTSIPVGLPGAAGINAVYVQGITGGNPLPVSLVSTTSSPPSASEIAGYIANNQVYTISTGSINITSVGTDNPLILIKNPTGSAKTLYLYKLLLGISSSQANIGCDFAVWANPTVTANGTVITPRPNLVGGSSSSAMNAFTLPTVTSNGTRLETFVFGQNNNSINFIEDFSVVVQANNAVLITGNPISNNRTGVITITWAEF